MHLRWRAFEQAAATAGEQGVAAEEQGRFGVVMEIGDVPEGMPGDVDHRELQTEHRDLLAIFQRQVAGGNALAGRPQHAGAVVFLQARATPPT